VTHAVDFAGCSYRLWRSRPRRGMADSQRSAPRRPLSPLSTHAGPVCPSSVGGAVSPKLEQDAPAIGMVFPEVGRADHINGCSGCNGRPAFGQVLRTRVLAACRLRGDRAAPLADAAAPTRVAPTSGGGCDRSVAAYDRWSDQSRRQQLAARAREWGAAATELLSSVRLLRRRPRRPA